jgi:hypothetical protein
MQERGVPLPDVSSWSQRAGRTLRDAYEHRASGIQVQSEGVVTRILDDDREGSRHQRFILRLDDGQTVLVAHNIDLAPRIDGLAVGDTIVFYGEYAWNAKGGVIHWTHRDPAGRHADGWLKHGNSIYQ